MLPSIFAIKISSKNQSCKFCHLCRSNGWRNSVLVHDNARPHVSTLVTEYLQSKRQQVMRQSPYSPDTNLEDFWLFSKLESMRVTTSFDGEDQLRDFLLNSLRSIPKAKFPKLKQKMLEDFDDIIDASGNYV